MQHKGFRLALIIIVLVLGLDILTKQLVLAHFIGGGDLIEVTNFFNIVLVFNPGISFGFFSDGGAMGRYALIVITLVITIFLTIWLFREDGDNPIIRPALGMAIGGAIGNLIDRIRYEAVVDFLDFHLMGYHWPSFNIADSAISTALIFLIIINFKQIK